MRRGPTRFQGSDPTSKISHPDSVSKSGTRSDPPSGSDQNPPLPAVPPEPRAVLVPGLRSSEHSSQQLNSVIYSEPVLLVLNPSDPDQRIRTASPADPNDVESWCCAGSADERNRPGPRLQNFRFFLLLLFLTPVLIFVTFTGILLFRLIQIKHFLNGSSLGYLF